MMLFEIHVTVDDVAESEFFESCHKLSIKPITIVEDTGSSLPRQMMTSFFYKGEEAGAYSRLREIAEKLPGRVIRRKLELICRKTSKLPLSYQYLEFHAKFRVAPDDEIFPRVVLGLDCHTARNAAKSDYRFVSARDETIINKAIPILQERWEYAGMIRECVIFDDNPSVDNGWKCECPLKKLNKTSN